MDFLNKFQMMGFYREKDGGAGGGGKSLEQKTNEKLGIETTGGSGDPRSGSSGDGDGGGTPDGGDGSPDDGGSADEGGEPGGEEEPGEGSPDGGTPSGEDPGADGDGGEEPGEGGADAGEGGASDGDGDGGSDMFYDPELHVEGEPSHSNKFPSREQAEFAAIEKAQLLKDKISEMKEDDVDPGAIKLPSAVDNDPEQLDNMTSLEVVNAMDDDDLRGFLNESDGSRQRLDAKHSRVAESRQARQYANDLEEAQGQLFDQVRELMDVTEIQENLQKFNDPEKGRAFISEKIDEKVQAELKEDYNELENWVEKVDSGDIDISYKEFDEEKQRRMNKIQQKEADIRSDYEGVVDTYERVNELNSKVENNTELSPEQKAEQRWDAFSTVQDDLGTIPIEQTGAPDLALFADTPEARAELVAAKNWAVQNKDDYNGLMTTRDWVDALENGWPEHKDDIRAGRQRDQIEDDDDGGSDGDDDIPKPGRQSKLEGEGDSVQEKNRSRLDKLEELTNAKVGA